MSTAAVLLSHTRGPFSTRLRAAFRLPPALSDLYGYAGQTGLLWTDIASDAVGLAYVAISCILPYHVHRVHRDIPFLWIFVAFGRFLVASSVAGKDDAPGEDDHGGGTPGATRA